MILKNGIWSDRPIADSKLDDDLYKFTMGRFIYLFFRNLEVVFGFKNRTKGVKIPKLVDIGALREELDHARMLTLSEKEFSYMGSLNLSDRPLFGSSCGYLDFLKNHTLPEYELRIDSDGEYYIRFPGKWAKNTNWEIKCMHIITELLTRAQLKDMSKTEIKNLLNEAERKLRNKILRLKKAGIGKVITDFGTRRRAFRLWQQRVLEIMQDEGREIYAGTSNVYFSMLNGTKPIGTFAHELYMVLAAFFGANGNDKGLLDSHNFIIKKWLELYGVDLSVILTDTFGTDFFFRDLSPEQAKICKALRHDSGEPLAFGDRAIQYYQGLGIDPTKKAIVWSDGLDVDEIIRIFEHFVGRILSLFGWGTNLTNDIGFPSMSLVVKALLVNGVSTVKLSDNLAKAMGSEDQKARYVRVFGYNVNDYKECIV